MSEITIKIEIELGDRACHAIEGLTDVLEDLLQQKEENNEDDDHDKN